MHKHTLYFKFIIAYLILGVVGFVMIATLGSSMVESQLKNSIADDLYREATTISGDSLVQNNTSANNLLTLKQYLSTLSDYQNAEIWILNNQGQRILSTKTGFSYYDPVTIDGFDPTKWGSYYRTGNFYGSFQEDMLSVLVPITDRNALNIRGYVVMHYPMSALYEQRESLLSISYILFLIFFVLSLSILLLFTVVVYRPLQKITKGTNEYAAGHLDYEIPLSSGDEIGMLAASLNYMSDVLNQNGEYQRNFIANISHDFRSPLTSIKGYVEAIADGTIPVEMQGKYLEIVSMEVDRLEKLTSSLLTLNNLEVKSRIMNIRSFDINKIIKNTAASFEGSCTARKILIELILTGEHLYVTADMEQIQQVLYNLLDNAIKFSSDESTITIETTEKGGTVFVSVKDHGTGIPKESLPKIWERFYKQDSSRGKDRKGTGLGLSIVKEIINAHNQHINVISTEGVGTEFIFTLEKSKS
ncbi:MAG TPA: HAMP domain-containing histidine kinase [Candidatus Blautia intestinigallinarum]|nr:HAMP domain-containing histidine kinase [Candidatus Blautia intestinigallinarum]